MSVLNEEYILSNGTKMPKIGLGTWQINGDLLVENTLKVALNNGYKHIDTAYAYQNEKNIGKAIKKIAYPREDIYITTKVPGNIKSYYEIINCFEQSLLNLQVEYVDMYLVHSPKPWEEMQSNRNYDKQNVEVWKAMEYIYKSGKARAIGVSNFEISDLKNIIDNSDIKPMANQIKFFIGNTQEELKKYCQANDIQVIGYSTLAKGALVNNKEIKEIAQKYKVETSQLCVKYSLQKNIAPLIKSSNAERIIKNAKVDFDISKEDMEYLDKLKNTLSVL